jgi:hypothetical protein
MADDAGANHVSDEFVFTAIPREQNGARTSAAIELSERMEFLGRQINFVLRDASGPEEPHDFDIFL